MSISPSRARSLCTRAELSLVKASARSRIGKLTPAQLERKTKQALRLRDKWGDVARKQDRRTQAKQRSRGTDGANARSAQKAALFADVLERFQSRARAVEKQQQKARRSAALKAVARARRKPATPAGAARKRKRPADGPAPSRARGGQSLKTDRRTQLAAMTSEKQSRFETGSRMHKFKHTTARNRRNQARRDTRRSIATAIRTEKR